MSVSEPVPMVRCRLDGPEDVPERTLRYIPLADIDATCGQPVIGAVTEVQISKVRNQHQA